MIACATRRGVIGAALAAAAPRSGTAGTTVPEAATLLVPGPEDGAAAVWVRRAAAGLSRVMPRAAALRISVLGGPDGVTAANRFVTISPQEGRVLLLMPGLAAQAWLVGDSRVRYEPRPWPAVCGGLVPAVLATRPGAAGALRVAIPGPAAPEAAGLLALDLLGVRAVPVIAPAGATADAVVAAGAADALVLAGGDVTGRAAALGLEPRFAFDTAGVPRDPALPDVPGLGEWLSDPAQGELVEAARAAGAALRTRGLLVLPALTSADSVAMWRGVARRWAEEERDGTESVMRRVVNEEAVAALAALCPPPEVALAYREWLLRRFGWRAA